MESLQEAAEQFNLDPKTARILTLQTALGAARLALESKKEVSELRQQVTSPGGTTEAALEVLKNNETIRTITNKKMNLYFSFFLIISH